MNLKRSRSRNSTANSIAGRPSSAAERRRSLIWSSAAPNTRRFGRPVSGSSDASRATWASASQRLVMSVKVCTKLPSGSRPLRTSITVPFGMRRSQTAIWPGAMGAPEAGGNQDVAGFSVIDLVGDELVEPRRVVDQRRRQVEELGAPAVDDRDLQVLGDQHDALAHVLEGQAELLGLLPGLALGLQDLLHGSENDERQDQARDRQQLERGPGFLEDLAPVDADADPQRMSLDLTDGDQAASRRSRDRCSRRSR